MSILALFGLQKIEKCIHEWITDHSIKVYWDKTEENPYKRVRYQHCSKCGKERKKVYK